MMNSYSYEFENELIVSNYESMLLTGPSDNSSESRVTFHFSCKHTCCQWIKPRGSPDLRLFARERATPALEKSSRHDVPRFDEGQKIILRDQVFKEIHGLPLSYLDRKKLSEVALDTVWDNFVMHCRPDRHAPCFMHLMFFFDVEVVHSIVFDEVGYFDWVTRQVPEVSMVPATDASIQSLRSKTIEYSDIVEDSHLARSCAVCLEDFEDGGDSVVTMECSHIYHDKCITKWLRTSHYCPVCRYQMPTEDSPNI